MVTVVGWDESAKSRKTCKGTSTNPGCGAIVEYDKNDIKEYNGTDYSGGPDGQRWVDCPNCKKRLVLESW
jgi:hypothetical protein